MNAFLFIKVKRKTVNIILSEDMNYNFQKMNHFFWIVKNYSHGIFSSSETADITLIVHVYA